MKPAEHYIDITDAVCPVTYAKIKLAIERMKAGGVLTVRLNAGEPMDNIPKALSDDGFGLLCISDNRDGTFEIRISIERR